MWWSSLCAALKSISRKISLLSCLIVILTGTAFAEEPQSLSIEQAIVLALENDSGLKASEFERQAAEYRVKYVRSYRYPVFTLEAGARFIDEVQSISTPLFSKEIGSKENYLANAMISVPLYTGGRISTQINQAAHGFEASGYAYLAKRLQTAYRCRQAYLNVMAAEAMVGSSTASRERLEIMVTDIQNFYRSGLADSLDIHEAALALEIATQHNNDALTALHSASSVLQKFIGDYSKGIVLNAGGSVPHPRPVAAKADSMASIVTRPEAAQLASYLRAARAVVESKQAEYLPNINAYAGYSYGKPNQDMFNKTWNDYLNASVKLNWSFNFGRQASHAVQEAKAAALKSSMALADFREDLELNARVALLQYERSYSSFEEADRELYFASRKYAIAQQRYEKGHLTLNRLLEEEAELTSIEKRMEAARIGYYLAQNDYWYAVGSEEIFGGIQ